MNYAEKDIKDISVQGLAVSPALARGLKIPATKADRDRWGESLIAPNSNRSNSRTQSGATHRSEWKTRTEIHKKVGEILYTARKRRNIETTRNG